MHNEASHRHASAECWERRTGRDATLTSDPVAEADSSLMMAESNEQVLETSKGANVTRSWWIARASSKIGRRSMRYMAHSISSGRPALITVPTSIRYMAHSILSGRLINWKTHPCSRRHTQEHRQQAHTHHVTHGRLNTHGSCSC